MNMYNEGSQHDCLEMPWKFIVQLLNVPSGVTDCIRCDVVWQISCISNSWHEDDVGSVTVDIVEVDCGSIAFVEEGTNVLDKIFEASLFCLSDVELMYWDKCDSFLCFEMEHICWASTPASYKCVTVDANTVIRVNLNKRCFVRNLFHNVNEGVFSDNVFRIPDFIYFWK